MMGGYPAEKWGERGRITTTERNGGGGGGRPWEVIRTKKKRQARRTVIISIRLLPSVAIEELRDNKGNQD